MPVRNKFTGVMAKFHPILAALAEEDNLLKNTSAHGDFQFVFGPAPSRRLGLSLGVDLLASNKSAALKKTCTMDCLYCEVGRTTEKTTRRFTRDPAQDILAEIKAYLETSSRSLDYITLAGAGEPTLNMEMGQVIRGIKEICEVKVAVLTNGSLLFMDDVQHDLSLADLVLPSLDAARPETFKRLCRPHEDLDLDAHIINLVNFNKTFDGELHLEILFARGINDSQEDLDALKKAVDEIAPDRVQINTVYRPPAYASAQPVPAEDLMEIANFFGPRAEVVAAFSKTGSGIKPGALESEIVNLIGRRPCSKEDLSRVLDLSIEDTGRILSDLERSGLITRETHADNVFFRQV